MRESQAPGTLKYDEALQGESQCFDVSIQKLISQGHPLFPDLHPATRIRSISERQGL